MCFFFYYIYTIDCDQNHLTLLNIWSKNKLRKRTRVCICQQTTYTRLRNTVLETPMMSLLILNKLLCSLEPNKTIFFAGINIKKCTTNRFRGCTQLQTVLKLKIIDI